MPGDQLEFKKWFNHQTFETNNLINQCDCKHCLSYLRNTNFKEIKYFMESEFRTMKSYCYMVTFTVDPKKEVDIAEVEAYVNKIKDREALQIIEAWYVIEHLDSNKHCHLAVKTKKPLCKSRFNIAQQKFGKVLFKKQKISEELYEMLEYFSKENEPIQII